MCADNGIKRDEYKYWLYKVDFKGRVKENAIWIDVNVSEFIKWDEKYSARRWWLYQDTIAWCIFSIFYMISY